MPDPKVKQAIASTIEQLGKKKQLVGKIKVSNNSARKILKDMGAELIVSSQKTKSKTKETIEQLKKSGQIDKKTANKLASTYGKEGPLHWLWNFIKGVLRAVGIRID